MKLQAKNNNTASEALALVAKNRRNHAGVLRHLCRRAREFIPPARVTASVCTSAATVDWFLDTYAPPDVDGFLETLVLSGQTSAIERAVQRGSSVSHSIMCLAIRKCSIDTILCIKNNYRGWTDGVAFAAAIAAGRYDVVRKLHLRINDQAYVHAAASGNMDACSWLLERGTRMAYSQNPAAIAAGRGHAEATVWMMENNLAPEYPEVAKAAMYGGLTDLLELEPLKNTPMLVEQAYKQAFAAGDKHLFEWAKAKGDIRMPEGLMIFRQGLVFVLERDDVDMFAFIHERAPAMTLSTCFDKLCQKLNSSNVLAYLRAMYGQAAL